MAVLTLGTFLETLNDPDENSLLQVLENVSGKDQRAGLIEFFSEVGYKQSEILWHELQRRANSALLGLGSEDDSEVLYSRKVLLVIMNLVVCAILVEDVEVTVPLREVVLTMHGVLRALSDLDIKVKLLIVEACENWWRKNLPNAEDAIVEVFLYHLHTALQPNAPAAAVKRVHGLRSAIPNFSKKPEIEEIGGYVLQAYSSAIFLKTDEGVRFLSSFLAFDIDFVDVIHKEIYSFLNQETSRQLIKACGQIYLRAWIISTPQIKEKLEKNCIQIYMDLATKVTVKAGFLNCLQVLNEFHKYKSQLEVSKMLYFLYEPIIWRSLQAPNSQVRSNSMQIFASAFPLIHRDMLRVEREENLDKQIKILVDMLMDKSENVRAVTIMSVGEILFTYWEMFPKEKLQEILSRFKDLTLDASSAVVRCRVPAALILILRNPLSHHCLKEWLPSVACSLNDTSNLVRIRLLDLLISLKYIKSIRYYSVVSIDELLSHLVYDADMGVKKRIVQLLMSSYWPTDRSDNEIINRTIHLLDSNLGAARCFYSIVVKNRSLGKVVDLIVLLGSLVYACAKKTLSESSQLSDMAIEDQENDDGSITAENTVLMKNLLEVVVILWEGISPKLNLQVNQHQEQKLQTKFSKIVPVCLRCFKNPEMSEVLSLLSGHVSPKVIGTFSRGTVSRLRLESSENQDVFGPQLITMCNWRQFTTLFGLLTEWLSPLLSIKLNSSRRSSRRHVGFAVEEQCKPGLALDFLSYILQHNRCRELLLTEGKQQILEFNELLKNSLQKIEDRLDQEEGKDDSILLDAFSVHLKVNILLHGKEDKDTAFMLEVLQWCRSLLLSFNASTSPNISKRRLLNQSSVSFLNDPTMDFSQIAHTDNNVSILLRINIIMKFVEITSDMMLIGIGSKHFCQQLLEFAFQLIDSVEGHQHLSEVSILIYRISEHLLLLEEEDHDATVEMVVALLVRLLTRVANAQIQFLEQEDVFQCVGPPLTEMIYSVARLSSKPEQVEKIFLVCTRLCVHDIGTAFRKKPEQFSTEKLTDLPRLASFLVQALCRIRQSVSKIISSVQEILRDTTKLKSIELIGTIPLLLVLAEEKKCFEKIRCCVAIVDHAVAQLGDNDEAKSIADLVNSFKSRLEEVCDD